MEFEYHVCGKGFVGCPGDASEFARRLEQLWAALPVSGAKPSLYHWHKHYDPYAGTAAVGGQYLIERTGNPSVNPVFILFAQTIGTPVRPPPEGWGKLRAWLDGSGWSFIALLGEERYREADAPPDGTIPLSGTMFELFDAVRTGGDTHLIVYDLSRLTQPPSPDTPEHQRQRAWRQRLIAELGKTYTVRAPETLEEFDQRVLKDLKAAFKLPALDPLHGALPSLAAIGVDEPLLFGRDDLIETLSRRIMVQGAAFTRVWGVSGAGKSSLLRAGLMGSWFDRSRGQAGLLAKATVLLIEPFQLGALDADPLRALGLLLTGAFANRDTGAIGPSPKAVTAGLLDLLPPSGDRVADLRAARAWWDELAAALDGPLVLIFDQAEQIDGQAKREARVRTDRDSKADSTPFLSPVWRRFVDLITSIAGVADPALDAPPLPNGPARFRLVLGLYRESAIDLWACDKAGLLANPMIEVPPLTDWRVLIQNTIAMYGLTLDELLLSKMAAEAEQLTNERQPVRTDDQIADDTRYDRASVLPLVKTALLRLITAWRLRALQAKKSTLTESDKMVEFAMFERVSGIADSVDALGEAAINLWGRALSADREVRGLFEREAFERELARRFDHLLTGLIDVGEKGRAELNYIRRDGELASDEAPLVSALHAADLLVAPDAEHWRLPHRTVIASWRRGRDFIARHETRLATKRRLVLAYRSGDPASDWRRQDISRFVELAFGWIGSDEAEDAELHDYLRSGLTARFTPEHFDLNTENALDGLPLRVLSSGWDDWAERLFERAVGDPSWGEKRALWTLVSSMFGRQTWLGQIFAPMPSALARQVADHVDPVSGSFPLLLAANYGYADCVSLLLENGADPNRITEGGGFFFFPLHLAARNGHAFCVRLLLEKGAKPNQIDETSGAFPLLIAAQNGHADCVRLLLDANAEPIQVNEINGNIPLVMATQNGHVDCVRLLLDKGANPNQVSEKSGIFPLLLAGQNGYSDCVRLLIDKGADPNQVHESTGTSPLHQAAQRGHVDCVRLLLDRGADPNKKNDLPLLAAASEGYAGCVSLLLDKGADPDGSDEASGFFPLLLAAKNGHPECVRLLLENGADPNRIHWTDGASPLRLAAQNGHVDCVQLLLEKGAEPNYVSEESGTFPLLTAAEQGQAGCVSLLLDKGANPNQINVKHGIFPLLQAAQHGWIDCVKLLIEKGADPNQANEKSGTSPLFLAAQNGHAECVRLLLDQGADPDGINEKSGTSPLLMAAQNGHAKCVRLLLDRGASPEWGGDLEGVFPLLQAALAGRDECVRLLLEKDADPDRINRKDGSFPLFLAAQEGHADCVGLLIEKSAALSQRHLPTNMTPLDVAYRNRRWRVVQLLGNRPGALATVSPEFHQAIKAILALSAEELTASERQAIDSRHSLSLSQQAEVSLPVFPGVPAPDNESVAVDAITGLSKYFGIPRESIEIVEQEVKAWRLTGKLEDVAVLIRFRLIGMQIELETLIFDLPRSHRRVVCVPGFDFDGLARSLDLAGRPLELRERTDALFWASLVLIYNIGATPILPQSPWPLFPGIPLPNISYPDNYWREWSFEHAAAGPTATLPFMHGGRLLRAHILVPENGIGVRLIGEPQMIASGLNLPVPRFISPSGGGAPTGLWLVREIEHD